MGRRHQVADCDGDLSRLPVIAGAGPCHLRIDSPGSCLRAFDALLRAGVRDGGDPQGVRAYTEGEIRAPALLHRGFVRVMRGMQKSLTDRSDLRSDLCPLAIAAAFDKLQTRRDLVAAGVPVAPAVVAPAVRRIRRGRRHRGRRHTHPRALQRAYVKLRWGSGAAGMVYLRVPPRGYGEAEGSSTVLARDGHFFHVFRLLTLRGASLRAVLGFILSAGAVVEAEVPHMRIGSGRFDLRVVALHGQPRFFVFRVSPWPMTNLQLGGRRGDPAACRARIHPRLWADAMHAVRRAASPGGRTTTRVGVDIVFDRNGTHLAVLELNAFGDFSPNLVDENGQTIHQAELSAWLDTHTAPTTE